MADDIRVPIPDAGSVRGEAARYFAASAKSRGRLSNASSVMGGYVPHIAKLYMPFSVAMQREGAGGVLSCRIKEMAILKTSYVNSCGY